MKCLSPGLKSTVHLIKYFWKVEAEKKSDIWKLGHSKKKPLKIQNEKLIEKVFLARPSTTLSSSESTVHLSPVLIKYVLVTPWLHMMPISTVSGHKFKVLALLIKTLEPKCNQWLSLQRGVWRAVHKVQKQNSHFHHYLSNTLCAGTWWCVSVFPNHHHVITKIITERILPW